MIETADNIAEQAREKLLHRIEFIIADKKNIILEQPVYVPRGEEEDTSLHVHRIKRNKNGELSFQLTADDDSGSFYWTFEDMSFDELYNVCIQLEIQFCTE